MTSSPKWVSPLACVLKKNGNVCLCEDLETNVTHDINGVFNISDDIIPHATNQNEH